MEYFHLILWINYKLSNSLVLASVSHSLPVKISGSKLGKLAFVVKTYPYLSEEALASDSLVTIVASVVLLV